MAPSVSLSRSMDRSLLITEFNEAFVETVLPAKMAANFDIINLFDDSDRAEIQHVIERRSSKPGPVAFVLRKTITTVSSEPNSFPVRAEFDFVFSFAFTDERFNLTMVPARQTAPNREASELRDFFNKAPIALHWLSGEGKVLWANDRELEVLEYTRDEYIGEDIMKFCPDSAEKVLDIFKELGSGNTIRDVPVRFRTKSGKVRDLLIDSNVNYKQDGSFNHTRCFIRDDTGRKVREARAEVLLRESERLVKDKGRFVAKLLHEIKTPLHIMSMVMSLGHSRENSQLLESQTIHLARLVSNMAIAMRFDDGDAVSEHSMQCNLVEFFQKYAAPPFLERSSGVDTILNINEGGGGGLVTIDTKKLTSVLDELLIYCDDVTAGGGRLGIRVTKVAGSGEYFVEVLCVGRVLDEASVHRIFHTYWLDSNSTNIRLSEDKPGLNLGLNVAFNQVQCMGSDLGVESTEEQTCFSFRLNPAPVDDPIALVKERGASAKDADFLPLHILIVEDNTICQKMCARLLKKLGHTCSVAGNGAVAVEMVTATDVVIYDFVLMDLRMPVMDGIDATKQISEYVARCQAKLPIVALTAEDDFDLTCPENDVGFLDVLKKPASIWDIDRVLREFYSVKFTSEQTCLSTGPTVLEKKEEEEEEEEDVCTTTEKSRGLGINDSASLHILLAEDNTICQKMCARLLKKLGHTCSVADNGAVAVEMVTATDVVIYDFVLMDIRMPVMDGIEATKQISKYIARCQAKLPIVALTAEDDFDITRPENDVGFLDVLKKPASVSAIEKVLLMRMN